MIQIKLMVFTRYLYNKENVEFSLVEAIREGKREEALFWAYELYHSGFQHEVSTIAAEQVTCPKLRHYFENHPDLESDVLIVGTIIENLLNRNPKLRIKIKMEDVNRHRTKPVIELKSWKIPRRECKYKLRTKPGHSPITIASYDNWIYEASGSPIWKKRIEKYGGTVCHESKTVTFGDDDKEEQFYNWHNFEPDEQPMSVQENWFGITKTI
jgi:hypothetical protein